MAWPSNNSGATRRPVRTNRSRPAADRRADRPAVGRRGRRGRRAFTLVEMIVVVGIILLLMGILLPAVNKAYTSSVRQQMSADLGAISTALAEYRSTYGYMPTVDAGRTGFAVLCKALMSPGPERRNADRPAAEQGKTPDSLGPAPYRAGHYALTGSGGVVAVRDTTTGPTTSGDWVSYNYFDGADGFGFRTRPPTAGVSVQGKVEAGFLPTDRVKTNGMAIVDRNGLPILYYANKGGNIGAVNGYAWRASYTAAGTRPRWNPNDNDTSLFDELEGKDAERGYRKFMAMIGARAADGTQDPTAPIANGDYLLWCAGPDRKFGLQKDEEMSSSNKSDDVGTFPYRY